MIRNKTIYKLLKTILILAFFFVGTGEMVAQNNFISIVKLYDGSIYRGEIKSEDWNSMEMILTTGDNINLSKGLIKKVYRGDEYMIYKKGRYHDTKGFFWAVGLGFNPAGEESRNTSEHFEILLGWRFNKNLSVAGGLGTELSTNLVGGFPVETLFSSYFVYGRYYLADWRQRPYFYGRAGYGIGPSNEFESGRHSGGLQLQTGMGFHFASKKRSKFNLSLGYHIQKTDGSQFFLDVFGNEVIVDYNLLIRRTVLKFSVEFR